MLRAAAFKSRKGEKNMHEARIIMLGGFRLDLSVLLMLVVTGAIVFIFAVLATRRLSVENPGKLQNFYGVGSKFVPQSDFQYNGYEER